MMKSIVEKNIVDFFELRKSTLIYLKSLVGKGKLRPESAYIWDQFHQLGVDKFASKFLKNRLSLSDSEYLSYVIELMELGLLEIRLEEDTTYDFHLVYFGESYDQHRGNIVRIQVTVLSKDETIGQLTASNDLETYLSSETI